MVGPSRKASSAKPNAATKPVAKGRSTDSKRAAAKETAASEDGAVLGVNRRVLDEVPARALAFLRAAGTSRAIRRFLGKAGYTESDHREGWDLLHASSGFTSGGPPELEDTRVRDAIRALDAWDEDGFRIIRASLGRHFPAQAKFVLEGIAPGVGPASVVAVETLLARLDQLEKGRPSTAKDDKAAIALLEARGINQKERQKLRDLLVEAKHAQPVEPSTDEHADYAPLAALHTWHLEWSEVARAVVRRRDYLIRLGLASQGEGEHAETDADEGDAPR